MFTLKIFDRNGTELKEGDIVRISNGRNFTFFCEVKYLEDQQAIAPFHTFSFHSVEKVEAVPEAAKKSKEERYGIWYLYNEDAEKDYTAEQFEDYLMDWRACEHNLGNRCYQITKTA